MNTNTLLPHSFIKIRRTLSFEGEAAGIIIKLVTGCMMIVGYAFGGWWVDFIIKQNPDEANIIIATFGLILGLTEMILKILLEKKHYTNISPYITLPIKIWKLKVHNFLGNLFKISNFINFAFFSAFFAKQIIVADYPIVKALLFITLIFGCELFHESLFNWFKSLNGAKSIISIIIYFALYIGFSMLVFCFFSDVECIFAGYVNPLTLILLIVVIWSFVWLFHSLQFNNERRNSVEDKTNSIIGSWSFSKFSPFVQLILQSFLRGKTLKSFIIFFLMGGIFIVNGLVQQSQGSQIMYTALGVFILFNTFSMFSQPICSYFSYYADGLTSRETNYQNNLLRSHYKIHIIYASIVAVILALSTQRFLLIASMYMLCVSLFYFANAFSNVFGGIFRMNNNDLSTIKKNFAVSDVAYSITAIGLSFLCVYMEENLYYNISIIAVCAVCLLIRDKLFTFLCNKFNEKRYANLEKYRGTIIFE